MYNTRIIFAALAAAIAVVHAQDLEPNDVPPECRSICQPVVDLENNCVVQYPNFFVDADDNDTDDNEIEQWLRNCGFSTATNQTGTAGVTPSPTRGPGATGIFSGSLTTATYTYTDIDDDDDDDQPETETRTTVFPVGAWTSGTFTGSYGSLTTSTATYTVPDDDDDDNDSDTITRTLVFPAGATPNVPGQNTVSPTTGSISFTTGTTTDAQGNTQVVTSPATTFDGAAAVATAGPLLGAGMAIMLAGMAL
ncbi:hypothetical protein HII31_09456 [Pseudocercospora fuligena]|uniref:Extracellular membrane protein CFEM domain-containing protein n=1 Tax=Pseudocercospora fuligena TaxID=685502 RepID=A0A8H6RDX0_9PEZI|nr:hypothetical protein HII31_09456 [Pseudocercospora fuligena]